jgi:hypothetical protein
MLGAKTGPVGPSNVRSWHLTDVHADRYFGRYRDKNGHAASKREPTRLTQLEIVRWVVVQSSSVLDWRR